MITIMFGLEFSRVWASSPKSNIRIDDFCIISAGRGGVIINNYIHLGCYSSLIGAGEIQIGNYSNISSRVSIYSSNDDYSGESLTNPTIPEKYKRLNISPVFIDEHVIIGSNTTILPGVNIERGVAIGAHSFVKESCEEFKIYAGSPVREIGYRSKKILPLQASFERGEWFVVNFFRITTKINQLLLFLNKKEWNLVSH